MLKDNYERILSEISRSCDNVKLATSKVTLLAVSKTRTIEEIQTLYDMGVRDFGENQVQELVKKYDALPKDIRWHMIGHLQRNKVKYIAPFIYCIHSVDSERLALEINKQALKYGRKISILIEINIGNESSKFGLKYDEINSFLPNLASFENIEINGFMTVAPYTVNPKENREYFQKMYELYVDNQKKKRDNVNIIELSMGMSNDYTIAIEEGATIVRVGTELFGQRSYIR